MWTEYFEMKLVLRGRIITPLHGELDFLRDDIPVKTCKELFESGFPYLEITQLGKQVLYGQNPIQQIPANEPISQKKNRKRP